MQIIQNGNISATYLSCIQTVTLLVLLKFKLNLHFLEGDKKDEKLKRGIEFIKI